MQENKQDKKRTEDEKQSHYEQPETDYTPQSTDRRDFIRKAGTAVVVGLGGILLGKTASADSIDEIIGDESESNTEFKKVTESYSGMTNCDPPCYPNCSPPTPPPGPCVPNCTPCQPDCTPSNCTPKCGPCPPECHPYCMPVDCRP
ncbi:twin-arginine translocation signal domain-containing protein [Candidatus Woesearchaeota archaeon]|nr:twin-arginine translocation signal domain-containing protein [Candidatus Woesearchaeota archaeon]